MRTNKLIATIFCALIFIGFSAKANTSYKTNCSTRQKQSAHRHNEASYQNAWCKAHKGIIEYENGDMTRVDCLTDTHAVEFDFSEKWAESIGQALHYGLMTGKKPMVVLILENPKAQIKYYYRVKRIADIYDLDVEFVTDDILKPNIKGEHLKNSICR